MTDPKWNRAQPWKYNIPGPATICGAARDFAREAAEAHETGLRSPDLKLTEKEVARFKQAYYDQMLDGYMTGSLEFAKAVTSGEFKREPWREDSGDPAELYGAWFNSLPDPSGLVAPPPADAGLVDPREHTSRCFERYIAQPCEAYASELGWSLQAWPAHAVWQHCGIIVAIWEVLGAEYSKYRRSMYYWRLFTRMRSRYAGTWNDYYITLWRLRRGVGQVVELHRRAHLTAPKWQPVAFSALRAMASLRAQYPEFESDFRAGVVACEMCDKLAIEARVKQADRLKPVTP